MIDDNSRGLLARKVVLEEQGYTVTSCGTPEEALEHFASQHFDIVVTDYRMPNIDGIQLISKFRAIRSVPVVLMSCMVEVLGLNESNTGADAVVAKNMHELPNMVRAVNRLALKPAKKPASSQGARKPTRSRKAAGE